MDLLTHICSGIAGATVIAALTEKQPVKRGQILAAGAVGGAFPDIDAISMWSRFDAIFGRLFKLTHSGQVIYGEKFWYSHHAFFHSIAAALLFGIVFGLLAYSIYRIKHKTTISFSLYCKKNIFIGIAFIAGYVLHLLGDMPTPASMWGGVNLFWPNDNYIGGSGKIWWWNNYDIFLLIVLCIIINVILLYTLKRRIQKTMIILMSALTILLIVIQINTRKYDYAYDGHTSHYAEMERHSKEEQKYILGKPLYSAMEWLDRHLPFSF
ncbi:MAG: metal-dependent hydrolase [Candidatus Azobacteroides sp.]|nr:metal-dependent hydrolase [Candidatus Azobacteroides sp.]